MTLTLIVISAAIAASAGFLASRRRSSKQELAEGKDAAAQKKPKVALPAPKPLDGFPIELGDVISAGGEERWLSGAIAAREQAAVMALFFAPEGREHFVVAAYPLPERDILWLRPIEVVSPAEPPATLEIEGQAMQRRNRFPVKLERIGQGAPDVGSTGIVATYTTGTREVAVVLTSEQRCLAWSGRRMDSSEYDRMGKSLEDE